MNQAKIRAFPEKVRFPLNEEMYGVFYEEINHAGEGGLYAELVRNRSFMDDACRRARRGMTVKRVLRSAMSKNMISPTSCRGGMCV